VIRELLLQRARSLGLAASPIADVEGRCETDEEALVREALERELVLAEPTDAECRRVYAAAPHSFRTRELYEASHILITPKAPVERAWEEARAAAVALIGALADGEATFEDAARVLSACPTAEQGGSLGQFRRGDLAAEIEAALSTLVEGEVAAAPVRTRHGWHVLRLDRRVTSAVAPYDLAAPAIRELLRARAWATAAARYVETLARKARIEGLDLSIGQRVS
jgi:peptidyl-prolyl cis-trans isomerase C